MLNIWDTDMTVNKIYMTTIFLSKISHPEVRALENVERDFRDHNVNSLCPDLGLMKPTWTWNQTSENITSKIDSFT